MKHVRSIAPQTTRRGFLRGLAGISSAALLAGCGLESKRVLIFFDNGRQDSMEVTLGNQPPVTIPPGEFGRLVCETGINQVKVTCRGETLYESFRDFPQDSKKRFLFNPDGNNRYRIYKVHYGSASSRRLARDIMNLSGLDQAQENRVATMTRAEVQKELLKEVGTLQPPSPWLEIGHIDHYFEPAPRHIIKGKYGSSDRTVLARLSIDDYEVLESALKNSDPSDDDLNHLVDVIERLDEAPMIHQEAKPVVGQSEI